MLTTSDQAIARGFSVLGDSYWSPLDSSTGRSLELPANGRVPSATLDLKPGESKSFEFELTNLLWNATMSSIWPHANLFNVMPEGKYRLVFKLTSKGETTSNKIEVVVE